MALVITKKGQINAISWLSAAPNFVFEAVLIQNFSPIQKQMEYMREQRKLLCANERAYVLKSGAEENLSNRKTSY